MKIDIGLARTTVVALLIVGAVAHAQQKTELPPAKVTPPIPGLPKEKSAQKEKKAHLSLDEPRYVGKTKTHYGVNLRYTAEDITATGNTAKYHEDTEVLEAEGNIVIDTEKAHITGNKVVVDDSAKKKLAIITENVIMEVKPKKKVDEAPKPGDKIQEKPGSKIAKPDGETNGAKDDKKVSVSEERGRGITVYCDRVENEYKKKYVKMFGNLTFKQKVKNKDGKEIERILFAEHAEYDGKADKMKLFAPVHGEDTEGQKVEFNKDVLVGTKEDEETLESVGSMKLEIIQHDDDDDKTPSKEPKKDDKPATLPSTPAAPPKKGVI